MATISYPRVLVLTQNKIQPFSGGGIVLSTLFRHFPADHLMFLHRDQEYEIEPAHEEYRMPWSWLRVSPSLLSTQLGRWLGASLQRPTESRPRDLLALLPASSRFEFPRQVARRIEAFRPDIIYAWAADSLWTRTLVAAAKRYRVPYVIHFMDNQFEVSPANNLQRALGPAFREHLTRAVQAAASVFTISEPMGEAYQRHWGRPYEVYRGTIDTESWPWPNVAAAVKDGIFRLGFAGSVDRSQLTGLSNVAAALDTLLAKGMRARLVLFLTDYYARMVGPALASFQSIEIRPHPEAHELRERFAEMDAMVLAYAFDAASVQYYRYSFATKSVAYMLSGRPILVHGPTVIEPVSYCARGGWALVAGDPGVESVARAVERLIVEPELRNTLAKAAWQAGRVEHDRERHAARFAASLSRLAGTR